MLLQMTEIKIQYEQESKILIFSCNAAVKNI